MSAIENRDMAVFQRQTLYYVAVFLASTVVLVFYRFTEERLGILWREQLTRRLTEAYLKDRTYYRLDSATGVANPDQRISDDVRAFTTTTLSFMLLIVNGIDDGDFVFRSLVEDQPAALRRGGGLCGVSDRC